MREESNICGRNSILSSVFNFDPCIFWFSALQWHHCVLIFTICNLALITPLWLCFCQKLGGKELLACSLWYTLPWGNLRGIPSALHFTRTSWIWSLNPVYSFSLCLYRIPYLSKRPSWEMNACIFFIFQSFSLATWSLRPISSSLSQNKEIDKKKKRGKQINISTEIISLRPISKAQ